MRVCSLKTFKNLRFVERWSIIEPIIIMSDLSLAVLKEVGRRFTQKTVVVNGRGDLSVDGVRISGIDGNRAIDLCIEGVIADVDEFGVAKTKRLYGEKAKTPGGLGNALKASVNLSRMLDADEVAGR